MNPTIENAPATGMARGVEVAGFDGLHGNDTTPAIFTFETIAPVRVVVIDGEPWFVGKDVAELLGYARPNDALQQHCKGAVKRRTLLTAGGPQELRIISEPDLWRLVAKSQLPEAQRVEAWIFEKVLPEVRRTGKYGAPAIPEDLPAALRLAADLAEQKAIAEAERDQAIATKAEIGSRREATAMATASAASRDADRLRKELGKHVETATILAVERALGRDFPRNAYLLLKAWCLEKGITPSSVPDARWGTVKSWPAGAWLAAFDIDLAELFGKGGEA